MAGLKQIAEFGRPKMSKSSGKYVLLFSILAFSFAYRLLLMHHATFPPGADIGLHNSVLHSITQSGSADFFWNFYQMGGGVSLTFPGYHIFVAFMISMTGLPDFLAHSLVVSLFSTITVACSFLITRRVWGESTGLIVAFLVAVSRFDLEMLLWGGFPNVATLMLMPLTFYLFLQRGRFTMVPFILSTTLLSSAIYITHSLSAVIFVAVTFATVFFALLLSRRLCISRRSVAAWILPLILGAIVTIPFLLGAVTTYVKDNTGMITGGVSDIQEALLSTRVLPPEIVVPLFACVVFFFLFSKEYKDKYLTLPVLLLTLWVLVPMFLTQGYLLGLYTDYNRFLYFVLMPVIMLIGMGIDHIAGFFARIADWYQFFKARFVQNGRIPSKAWLRLQRRLISRNVYTSFALSSLLIAFLFIPIFMTPFQGVAVQSFYQVMTNPGYDAIQWARENTDEDSVFVSDALYGWWLGGFAQRPTLSAVDPQYLTLSRELALAKNASYLLDTDYVVGNGLIQIREDGGYIGRHNPMFLAMLNWTYFPYPFFNFNNDETSVSLVESNNIKTYDLSQLSLTDMNVEIAPDRAWASIYVCRGNSLFNYTQIITIYKNLKFANVSVTLESNVKGIDSYEVHLLLQTKGDPINNGEKVGFFDKGAKVLGQLIFTRGQPSFDENVPELVYSLSGESNVRFEIWAGAFPISDDQANYKDQETEDSFLDFVMSNNLASFRQPELVPDDWPHDLEVGIFDYGAALTDWNVSYIACRDSSVLKKFASDPIFSRVFINAEVSVFRVKSSPR